MWTPTTRQQHSRSVTRYQTDLTDAEWRVIAPHLPKPCAMGPAARVADARDH
jgi:putative transposase